MLFVVSTTRLPSRRVAARHSFQKHSSSVSRIQSYHKTLAQKQKKVLFYFKELPSCDLLSTSNTPALNSSSDNKIDRSATLLVIERVSEYRAHSLSYEANLLRESSVKFACTTESTWFFSDDCPLSMMYCIM